MDIDVKRISILLAFLLMLIVGAIFLQIYLSKRESRWPGLVLPGICILYPLLLLLNVAGFGAQSPGNVINTVVLVVVLSSLPALVLLAIYAACRGGRRKNREMEKMNIHDL